MAAIPYGRQQVSQSDVDAVTRVLTSEFLTQGPVAPEFEDATARHSGAAHGVAVNSATSALHIACLALGLGSGDRLWTSPISFVASSNCARYCGAEVDFVDIDPRTYNLCPQALSEKLLQAKASDKLPKIVMPVHLCGQSCDMAAIKELSNQYGFKIIEDASHAIGGKYRGKEIGGCDFSDITVFSFHPVKIITAGEGGMALTNNADLARRMSLLRSHGITRDTQLMMHEPHGPWYYEQIDLGFNYRMSDIHAALGLSQLGRLDEFVSSRRHLAKRYNELLDDERIELPWEHPENRSAYHLYVIRLQLDKFHRTHLEVFQHLRDRDLGVNLHYIPIYKQPYYQKIGFDAACFPESEQYYAEAISLPIYPAMTQAQQDKVISVLKEALGP
jgi:UDP-4-amino-4,6-dideoxy-N-acetyl-beta-L-altrosamine transaminase